jgi:hypothetical protein
MHGALETISRNYILPSSACKTTAYSCPSCDSSVILKNGNVRVPHFAHAANSNCKFYVPHPSESDLHKAAKYLLAQLLRDKTPMYINYECYNILSKTERKSRDFCNKDGTCGEQCDVDIMYNKEDQVFVEYINKQDNTRYDVCVVNDNKIKYIFEIKVSNKTTTYRPEPWFELNASGIMGYPNQLENEELEEGEESLGLCFSSIRTNHLCDLCLKSFTRTIEFLFKRA